ncbi:DUF3438 family protein [Photobacterium leiognathi]|uniref:DUF3438 family protein n=1 Tax=Photobacterium leiognathi TaxID=553611 RepID=UPI002981CB9B|nr:DUF3438 family protein [Photobacterium leiognathi]
MKNKHKLTLLVSSVLAACSFAASATEVMKWDGAPLQINLKNEQQRLIRMPDNAMFRVPVELKGKLLVDSAAGVLYVQSNETLKNVPVEAKLASTGEIIKFNINSSAKAKGTDDEIRVVMPWENDNASKVAMQSSMPVGVLPDEQTSSAIYSDDVAAAAVAPNESVSPNELIRYAAMRNFMPSRLWTNNSQIQQLPALKLNLDQLFYGRSTNVFHSRIESAYKAGDMNLYVITLRNRMPFPVDVRFDDIAIDFSYASVPEPYYALGATSSQNNFSYLYLITKHDIKTLIKNVDPSVR